MGKTVIDTHVWISFFYRGRFEKILQSIIDNDVLLYTCHEQVSEFKKVYSKEPKIRKLLPLDIEVYETAMVNSCEFFEPQKRYALLPDYKDNYLVDLAHQTRSQLVSNDRDFSLLKKLKSPRIKIITLHQFYQSLGL